MPSRVRVLPSRCDARPPAAPSCAVGSCIAHRSVVLTLLMPWLIAALSLAAVLAIDDRFGATAYARFLLVAVAASVIAALINRSRQREQLACRIASFQNS